MPGRAEGDRLMTRVSERKEETAPVPFFMDSRTLSEKLTAENREWRPHEPQHECPAMIFGLVLERGTYHSKFGKEHETARLLTADNIVWSVIGFHGYLQSEFERKNPRVGDFVAIAYLGTKPAKKEGESDANVYRIEVERNPAGAVPVETDDRGTESLVGSDPAPTIPPVDDEPLIEKQRVAALRTGDDDIPF